MSGNDKQTGFAYMSLLVVITASLIALSVALPDKYQQAKREREAQLVFVGQQYVRAIKLFYENPLVSIKRYPETIDELLVDKRTAKSLHHLRKLYTDPMTDSYDWGLVKNAEKQIMGVYSLSKNKPLRTDFSALPSVVVVGGEEYNDIKFVYLPK
jgi:hypothetical protein